MTQPTDQPRRPEGSQGAGSPAALEPPQEAPAALPPAEPRQRWRLTFRRDPVPADAVGRSGIDAWQDALAASGLPLAGLEQGGPGRARIAFAAPLPAAARGLAELAEIWLLERVPRWVLRTALETRLPAAHTLVDAEDVWLGAPALAGRIAAADWQVALQGVAAEAVPELEAAARTLVAARTLPRTRLKGTTEKRYDLRPLFDAVAIEADPASGGVTVRIRTRFAPELGAGRPEEVVAALGDAAGRPITPGPIVRNRLLLSEDLARKEHP